MSMSVRAPAAALAPGLLLALALGAGEAAAQSVCRGGPQGSATFIACDENAGSAANILIAPGSVSIDHATESGMRVLHSGSGDAEIRMTAGSVVSRANQQPGLRIEHQGTGGAVIRVSGGSVETRGAIARVVDVSRTSGAGDVGIYVTGGSLSSQGQSSNGLTASISNGISGNVTVSMSGGSIAAQGPSGLGVSGVHSGPGNVTVSVSGSVSTKGNSAAGVSGSRSNASTTGTVAVTLSGSDTVVKTEGHSAHGVNGAQSGQGDVTVTMTGGLIETMGAGAIGLRGHSRYQGSGVTNVAVVLEGGAIRTRGGSYVNIVHSHGVYADRGRGSGSASVRMTGGSVETAGARANGIVVFKSGPAGAGSIATAGDNAYGAYVYMYDTGASTEGLSIDAAGAVSAEGLNARGLAGFHLGLGSAAVRTRAAAEIAAPFAIGMEGRLTNDDSAAGRIMVTHAGAAEARDAGILAWAARSSGHTMGSTPPSPTDDAARTAPMIHVTSSGNVTVGVSVRDAFIRGRIAGADETLSAAERAVLDAITAEDSSALTTALAALPADDYDAAWKAEAQELLRKRSAAPTGDGPLAHAAAEEILGLSRAGVRAMALSHTAIADHIRAGDALSAAERAALTAVLSGDSSGLTTALTALTGAAYTTAWKNTVRQHALTYNAGDIQVDVTGGSIDAEGNGVEALYAVPHDSNGAIAVTVAAGARVTGGAKGIYVRGAGATMGARNQTVTVNGAAMGGTGAGVHLVGGGAVTVGAGGEVGATSSVGVLGDGGGDLTATVSGTVTGDIRVNGGGDLAVTVKDGGMVTGDLRVAGGGSLTATVEDGGAVAGTIHNPQPPLTVAGSVGRVLYASGGTVEVSGGGKLTGVEGVAVESTAGALSVTVNDEGRVEGDIKSGGTLMATVEDGGVVTGTIEDPQASFTVAGSVGRVLYASGGTVTVAATGALTGVEVEGRSEALRSEAGDLALTVAGRGRVTGDVRALGDGDLTATVAGTLTGDVIEEGDGDLSATVSGTVDGDLRAEGGGALTLNLRQGGTVTGTVHDPASPLTVAGTIGRLLYTNGATVTVAATGALTGVEVEGRSEALRSEAGDLDLSVAGTVTGDVRALGDGDLEATISGTLTGDVFGLGAGEHTVTVANGGTVTGTVHLAASTVRVDGRAGRVRFDKGGTVTVGTTGWITGIEVGGRTEAIRNAAGDLVVSVAGRVTGDIIDLGARPARVTTEPGSRVAGSVEVAGAGSEVRVGGTVAEQVRFRRGGRVTVGPDGKVEGRVSSDEGELVAVVVLKPEETEDGAWDRAFPAGDPVEEGGTPTLLTQPEEGGPTYARGMVPGEADAPVYEARMRVYEALPSVVLELNGLRGFRERMAAPRSAQGGWARVEALRGKWKAEASTSGKESGVGLEHRHRRHGIQVGLTGALGEEALVGVSLHHRRGSAEVSEGGDLELSGTGAGVSGTWVREEVYVDVQAEVTGYEADLTSSRRGVLKKDVSGLGHALGVEAGRRLALERLPAGLVLTPRAGLVHSRVSVDAFSDAVGSRVTVDGARSLKGRVGVEAEVKLGGSPGSRVFGSVEVEHEFSTGRKVRVSGRELKSEADATWLRLDLDGAHTWEDGRYTLQGGVGYATSGSSYEFGGGVSLNLRF